jgi:hypothetical protein
MRDLWRHFSDHPGASPKLAAHEQSELLARAQAGESATVLASDYGVSVQTVHNYLGRAVGKRSTGDRAGKNRRYKMNLREIGVEIRCEACGWKPPRQLWKLVEVHHIVPISCGGEDCIDQVILLCPNHHALADALFKPGLDDPPNRDQLIAAILDPDAYIERRLKAAASLLR